MRRLVISRFGGPEVLEWQEAPDPVPGPGELLVRTTAFAVMWADLLEREGRYPGMGTPPLPVGHDLAGVVQAHGPGIDQPPIGTRVFGIRPQSGSAAELVTLPAHWVYPTPDRLSDTEAAGFIGPYFSADGALVSIGRLQPGESVLVHAAAGGLGSAAVQLARSYGAGLIIATAGSDDKLTHVSSWGADVVINYHTQNFVQAVQEATDGRGVDLVIDSVGGDVLGDSFDCVAPTGRIVTMGASSGTSTKRMRIQTLFDKGISIGGFTLGLWYRHHPELIAPIATRVFTALDHGDLTPHIGATFPAHAIADAHHFLADRRSIGRTVIEMPTPATQPTN